MDRNGLFPRSNPWLGKKQKNDGYFLAASTSVTFNIEVVRKKLFGTTNKLREFV
jgi:hypothetical protein